MKIGLTGSNGFLGRNLIKILDSKNEITQFKGDITDKNDVEKFMNNKFDIVFHLAGAVPKFDEGNDLTISYSINQVGTKNIVDIKWSPYLLTK